MTYPTYSGKREDEHCCPKGSGGNSTVTNQDEAMILARTARLSSVRTEGSQDSDFH